MYCQNTFVKILSKTGFVGKDLYDREKIIQVWLTLDIIIMLLETKYKIQVNSTLNVSMLFLFFL